MIISKLLTTPCSRKSGSQLGSGLRRIACLAALLVIFVASGVRAVPVSESTFPDANFRSALISKGYAMFTGSLYETIPVTAIDVKSCNISDLTGIVYFPTLNTLDCSSNKLSSLILTGNTLLQTLDCSNNNLSSVNLSQNALLTTLTIYKNKLRGSSMDTFIQNLFDRSKQATKGELRIIYDENASTGNKMTSAQVEAAKKRGWTPKMSTNGTTWTDYPGSDAIAINATNFPDENFREWLLEQSYGKDGYLTEEEIAKIKQLDVSGRSISDLTGIEYFTALISLLCYDNNINEANMTKLVRSLPTGTYMRDLLVYKDGSSAEKNFFNLEHLNRAKDRNWGAMLFVGDTSAKFTDYVIYANFPDENFRSYVSTNLDKNGDGWLLPSEIAAVTEINVDNKGIADLTGIEYFTNLTSLICCRNDLTTLDVSKNILLRHILCDRNQIRGKGMNTLVNSLHTSFIDNDWPEDWRPKLIVINGDATPVYNWITQSQVQNAESKGWEVMRYNNQYGYVDYAGELPGIPINEANFPDANFRAYVSGEDIDQDGDGYLNEMEVWWVTEINVSNLNISDLKGIEFFNGLKELDCSYNQLTSLDVSHNYALTRLYCYCNRIRGTDMTKLVNSLPDRKSASEEGTLWVYYIDDSPAGNMMTPGQVEIAREKNWNVVMWDDDYEDFIPYEGETPDGIEISEANFPDDNFREYVGSKTIDKDEDGYLSDEEIEAVTEIDVMDMDIEDLTGIGYFTALKTLYAGGNKLTELDLSKNTALDYLGCSDNQLTELDLGENTALTTLYCGGNQLTELDLRNNTKLESVNICNSQIYGEAMDRLIESLPTRTVGLGFGRFYAVDTNSETEGNIITKLQKHNLSAKRWSTLNARGNGYYPETIPGDFNGDGLVNTQDIDCLRDYILGINSGMYIFTEAELTDDDAVDIVDLTKLIKKLTE